MIRFMLDRPQEELDQIEAEERRARQEVEVKVAAKAAIVPTAAMIMDRLAVHAELPPDGFLAGGSVANTYLSILDGRSYPVNDLDIFRPDLTAEGKPVEEDGDNWTEIRSRKTEFEVEYGVEYFYCRKQYEIRASRHDGLINTIDVGRWSSQTVSRLKPPEFELGREFCLNILDGFDINACQAGIDLATGELFLTQAFLDFVEHRHLEPWDLGTPYRTAIRLVKKSRDLEARLDLHADLSMLATATMWRTEALRATNQLMERYDEVRDQLKDFIKCEEVDGEYFLSFNASLANRDFYNFMRSSHLYSSSGAFRRMWKLLAHKETPYLLRQMASDYCDNVVARYGACCVDGFLDQRVPLSLLEEASSFFYNYGEEYIPAMGRTLAEVVDAVAVVNAMPESDRHSMVWLLGRAKPERLPFPLTSDNIQALRSTLLDKMAKTQLVQPLPLLGWFNTGGRSVKEITTEGDLVAAASRLEVTHWYRCNSVINDIKNGYSRYFLLESGGDVSLVSIFVLSSHPAPPKFGSHFHYNNKDHVATTALAKHLEWWLIWRYFTCTPKLAARNSWRYFRGWCRGYHGGWPDIQYRFMVKVCDQLRKLGFKISKYQEIPF